MREIIYNVTSFIIQWPKNVSRLMVFIFIICKFIHHHWVHSLKTGFPQPPASTRLYYKYKKLCLNQVLSMTLQFKKYQKVELIDLYIGGYKYINIALDRTKYCATVRTAETQPGLYSYGVSI